jgi:hypothetical protein
LAAELPIAHARAGVKIAICLAIAGWRAQPFAESSRCSTGDRIVDGKIFNSKGLQVGVVTGGAIYGLKGHKLYELKGANIYKLSGELMGHLNASHGSQMRLDRSTDRLFLEK